MEYITQHVRLVIRDILVKLIEIGFFHMKFLIYQKTILIRGLMNYLAQLSIVALLLEIIPQKWNHHQQDQ